MEIRVFRFRTAFLAALFLCLAFPVSCTWAHVQETGHQPPPGTQTGDSAPPPTSSGDAVSVDTEGSGESKLPIENVAPYSSWKHHTATKAEEALVPVYYTEPGSPTRTLATGLVIRCDGFVLVPKSVRDVARNGGRVEVILSNVDSPQNGGGSGSSGGQNSVGTDTSPDRGPAHGDAHGAPGQAGQTGQAEKRPVFQATQATQAPKVPTVTALARNHTGTHVSVPYALVKTNDHHVRSLPLLSSTAVAPGKPVRLLWFLPGSDPAAAPERQALRGTIGGTTENKDVYSVVPAVESEQQVPFGAVVIDEESGAALGIVTQGGTNPAFISLARFQVISSDIGVAPDRAAVRLGDRSGSIPPGVEPMVFVPGGPVVLDGVAGKNFTRDFGTTVVCTPGFWMAVNPVTNVAYRNWMKTGTGRNLPFGWNTQDLYNPVRRDDRPACGMGAQDADLFAAAHGSRLPTEVEWRRAAYSPNVAWVAETQMVWDEGAKHVRGMIQALTVEFSGLTQMAQRDAQARLRELRNSRIAGRGETNVQVPSSPALDAMTNELRSYADQFVSRQDTWGEVHLTGSFPQDRSVFGVRHVVTNAAEMVLSRDQETLYAPKLFPAVVDPDLTQFNWVVNQRGTEASVETLRSIRDLMWNCLVIMTWRGGNGKVGFAIGDASGAFQQEKSYFGTLAFGATGQVKKTARPGFRCAR